MKKKAKKYARNIEHRGNDKDVSRTFEMEMRIVHGIKEPKAYYSREGGMEKYL